MWTARDLLLSTLKIHPVETSQPFYNKYQYSVKFTVSDLGVIRGLKFDKIDQIVKNRNAWRLEHTDHFGWSNKNQILPETVKHLKSVCSLLIQYQDSIKFVVSYDTGYVYTNDLETIKIIKKLKFVKNFRVRQAIQVSPPGTIALKNPKWSHRTYFRSIVVTESAKKMLINYLHSRENVRLSPGLIYWSKHNSSWNKWIQSYYFFDHDNDGEVLFLNMVVPRITGRTLNIVAK